MLLILLAVFFGLCLAYDWLLPRLFYDWQARRHKAGSIVKSLDFPFGLVSGIRLLMNAAEGAPDILENAARLSHSNQTTFMDQNLFKTFIFTWESDNIKAMLSTQFAQFNLGYRNGALAPLLGNGIFNTDGAHWKHGRAMLRPLFARDRVSHTPMLEQHCANLINLIDGREGSFGDLQDEFQRLTFDTAIEFLFGITIDSLRDVDQDIVLPSGRITSSRELTATLLTAGKWMWLRSQIGQLYWIATSRKFRKDVKVWLDFADEVIEAAKQQVDSASEKQYSFVRDLCEYTNDKTVIRDQALSMVAAGRGTTSSMLSFTLLGLASTGRWATLREHVLRDLGPDPYALTFERLKSCKYLQWCLNESLRVYPTVPVNVRYAVRNTTLPRGGGPNGDEPVFVRKGGGVVYVTHTLQHDPKIWGEDADAFRPERWQDLRAPAWAYIPFSGGPRVCLGQQFALTEGAYILARLCQEYRAIELRETPGLSIAVTLTCKDGLHVAFTR